MSGCWCYWEKSNKSIWGFAKKPVLSITSSGQIGFWEHDKEASKMQGRARGRKGERKTNTVWFAWHTHKCCWCMPIIINHIHWHSGPIPLAVAGSRDVMPDGYSDAAPVVKGLRVIAWSQTSCVGPLVCWFPKLNQHWQRSWVFYTSSRNFVGALHLCRGLCDPLSPELCQQTYWCSRGIAGLQL